jgi:hypothetical protein
LPKLVAVRHLPKVARQKKILILFARKNSGKNVDEIEPLCQFRQHFKSSLCTDILAPKKYKPKMQAKLSYEKATRNILVKLTTARVSVLRSF